MRSHSQLQAGAALAILNPLVPRFRLPWPVWRSYLLGAVCIAATAIFASAEAFAQVPPVGATAEVRDATGRLLANGEFREGRGEVLITLIFPSPSVLTGTHGLRIASVGRCDPPDFSTAGPGFNPLNRKHGRQNPDGPQVGDLPNVNFTNGLTSYNTSVLGATLASGPTSLLGPSRTALVIYSGEDDQVTDPDGKAGSRIGCGVITPAGGAAVAAQPAVPKPIVSPVPAAPAVQPAPAQPAPASAKPASSPIVVSPPQVVNPALPKPATSPIATPTGFVPAVAVPTAALPVAATATQTGGGLGTGPALLIAIFGVGLVGAGYLLRRRGQLTR
ncbi:MAG: superoxide dismutase family protein [Chloroflexi bacterium]|nr:superoxide dismutase family protein [Chloroflexota bacterium]